MLNKVAPLVGAVILALSVVIALASSHSLADYDYVVDVYVSNASGSDLTNVPVAITIQANNLVANAFIQADAEDLRPVNTSESALPTVAQEMASNSVTWWLDVDSVADGSVGTFQFYMGNTTATRDQMFRVDGTTDTVTAADHADLDILDDLTLTTTFNAIAWPNSDTYLVNKSGAYGIGLRISGGDETAFAIIHTTAVDQTREPNATVTDGIGQSGCADGSIHECLASSDADTSYVWTSGGGSTAIVATDDLGSISDATINSVTLRHRSRSDGTVGTHSVTPSICYNACAQVTAGVENSTTTSYADYDQVFAQRPGGGSWGAGDFDDLQIRLELNDTGGGGQQTRTTYTAIIINYTPYYSVSTTTDDASVNLVAGADYTLALTYDNDLGSNQLKLAINGTNKANATSTGNIVSNTSTLVAGSSFNGYLDATRVGTISLASPTWVLQWDYEPDELTETQQGNSGNSWTWLGTNGVEDVSSGGSDHDGSYSLTRDMTGVTRYTSGVDLTVTSVVSAVPTPPNILGGIYMTPVATFAVKNYPFHEFPATAAAAFESNNVTPQLTFWFLVVNFIGLAIGAGVFKLTGNGFLAVLPWIGSYWIAWQAGAQGFGFWLVLIATMLGLAVVPVMRRFNRGIA